MQFASVRTKIIEEFRKRLYVIGIIIICMFAIFFLQLINLQIFQGREFSEKSRMNMENNIPLPASRGEIYDRNFSTDKQNIVLATNRPAFNIIVIPAQYKEKNQFYYAIKNICALLQLPYEEILTDLKSTNPYNRYIIQEDVPFDIVVTIATNQDKFPNIMWEDAPVRVYPFNNMFSHVIGYIGSLTKEEYNTYKDVGYKYYQKIGKAGIERQYDSILRGVDGYVRRIVDAKNRTEGEEIGQHPKSGYNIVLTLDYDVQKTAYTALGDNRGSVIVMKPATGEIISIVSKPDYDPNLIISKNNIKIITELNNDKNKPFLNRAIQSRYPPASTFKLVTSIAALEEEKWDPAITRYCPGKYTLKGYVDRDFYCYQAHGSVNLLWAIARSCSVYFYQLGLKLGPTTIFNYAGYLGLAETSGIDIPGEITGFIPSKKWKLKTFGQPWFDGDTVNLSIGQGFMLVTPIGMMDFLSAIVNSGVVFKPHCIKEIRSIDNTSVVSVVIPEKLREIPLSPTTLNTIKQGMRMAVVNGTAARLGYLKVQMCGKTGTAQTRSKRQEDVSQHAWFVGFGPYDSHPEKVVAIVVMVEYGIAGAATAVPIAEQVFTTLIKKGYF
ncbi:MAG: penicillin-binding protein 2 [Spirochaetes bacterium]|nr:penicillin-binding protein 2 [Spirochaetota bacterium]